MASTGQIGPKAQIRVDGKSEHDIGTFNWTVTQELEPFGQVGADEDDRYTAGPRRIEWDAEVQARPDGSYAVPWDANMEDKKTFNLVFATAGLTERLLSVGITSIGNAYDRESGKWIKSLSGKALSHKYG